MFLDISFTILWRCKLKSPQNGNLKKRIIHLSRNIAHMTYTTGQYKTWTADYGLRTGYEIRTRYKTWTGKYGLSIKQELGIKHGLRTADWV